MISVIVPAYERRETLGTTLESLIAQTFTAWEAIVVDDGSTDGTAAVAADYAARDGRIRVHRQANAGVSRARNAGIELARGQWLLFLDADDWLAPDGLERLIVATHEPADAVCGANVRIYDRGRDLAVPSPEPGVDMAELFAHTCAVAVHACLVRTELVRRLGGFDEQLVTCEDWDLWQRLAHAGARFVSIPQAVAFYRIRVGSASTDGWRMLHDGLDVIDRGHAAQAGTPARSRAARDRARTYFACYAAGLEIAAGRDARGILTALGDDAAPDIEPNGVAESLFLAIPVGRATAASEWFSFPDHVHRACDAFIDELGRRVGSPALAIAARLALERLLLAETASPRPLTVGRWHLLDVELDGPPVADLELDQEVDRVLCTVRAGGERVVDVEVPVVDGWLPARVLADAIVAQAAWKVLGAHFAHTAYRRAGLERDVHDEQGWTVFLRELWDRPHWQAEQFYGGRRRAWRDGGPRRRVAAQPVALDVCDDLPALRARGESCIAVALTVAGAPLTVVEVPLRHGRCSAHALRTAILTQVGFELCRAVVREAVLLAPSGTTGTLRERLRRVRDGRGAEALPAGVTVVGRGEGPDGTAVSRWTAVPANAAAERLELAHRDGDPIAGPQESVVRLLVAPWTLADPAGRRRGRARLAEAASPEPGTEPATRLPILMYHRVAPHGKPATRRWRLHPEAFEEQLSWLRQHGYRTITLEAWRVASERRAPIPARSVMLTFDDGYADFPDHALPLLRRYGFAATMFVVTDLVGGWNAWDDRFEDRVELMDWATLRTLPAHGVEIGSHSAGHRELVALPSDELVRDLAQSRLRLHEELGLAVRSICYPYGLHDLRVLSLAGACGFHYGLTTRHWRASLEEELLRLPRLEVRGDETLAEFAAKLSG